LHTHHSNTLEDIVQKLQGELISIDLLMIIFVTHHRLLSHRHHDGLAAAWAASATSNLQHFQAPEPLYYINGGVE